MADTATKNMRWDSKLVMIVTIVTALCMALVCSAAGAAAAEYIVEIIVFENQSPSDGGERWRDDEEVPSVRGAVDLANNSAGISELGQDHSTLANTLSSLIRSGHYRLLSHKIWEQPGYSRNAAKAVRVNSVIGRLDGTVRLERGRYLHLYIDLAYYPRAAFGNVGVLRLTQQRRMRKEEVHYFDHPRYGVLAVVRSVESDAKK